MQVYSHILSYIHWHNLSMIWGPCWSSVLFKEEPFNVLVGAELFRLVCETTESQQRSVQARHQKMWLKLLFQLSNFVRNFIRPVVCCQTTGSNTVPFPDECMRTCVQGAWRGMCSKVHLKVPVNQFYWTWFQRSLIPLSKAHPYPYVIQKLREAQKSQISIPVMGWVEQGKGKWVVEWRDLL